MVHYQGSLKLGILLCLGLFSLACQPVEEPKATAVNEDTVDISQYPVLLQKAWDAHGGLDKWQRMSSLSFSLYQDDQVVDQHVVDLESRSVFISSDTYRIGYDGQDVWHSGLSENNLPAGSARFYHNLHFYFLAMPFVLADEGLKYDTLGQREIQGKFYEGVRITFEDNIGDAPDDEYRVYFDPDTHQMTWLLYTVTYFSAEESEKFSARLYRDWQWVNGLLLPLTCEKYNWTGTSADTLKYTQQYLDVIVDALPADQSMFLPPAGALLSD